MFSMTKLLPYNEHKSKNEQAGGYNWATYDKMVNISASSPIALFGDVTIDKTIRTSK